MTKIPGFSPKSCG